MITNYRRCLSCRRTAPKEEFWQVIRVYPDHQVQLDQGMGRSAYLCPQARCLTTAQKKNRLGRSIKAPVPDQIYQQLWYRLAEETDKSTHIAAVKDVKKVQVVESPQTRDTTI